ncbi:hypothetical protein ACFQZO_10610 [Bradyrhizobium sp. GCM10027634]|uniref:hypothetical protein n=1 Tax=unclassified Bradyrhizobium TaxID=2631580 RepID=UPI00263A5497|nr:hypothetical protein [Bradyrhizobium sp. WYCCWR 12677]MDN5001335.1 hypothetical protein [Bradyrhizobium sp. WYCCWR 12677]
MRCIIALLAWLASTVLVLGTEAGKSADFASAMPTIMANLRSAASYVRTGNIALAQMEIDEAVAAWKRLEPTGSGALPAFAPAAMSDYLDRGRGRLATITRALDSGDNIAAGRELLALRQSFHDLRRDAGLYELGDCIFEIAPAMEKLRVAATRYGEQPAVANAEDTVATASAFRDRLQRCNEWARPEIAEKSEFRRLIDGAIASSGEVAHAAMAGDGPLVHRYLIELQSYAQLLDFRYG